MVMRAKELTVGITEAGEFTSSSSAEGMLTDIQLTQQEGSRTHEFVTNLSVANRCLRRVIENGKRAELDAIDGAQVQYSYDH